MEGAATGGVAFRRHPPAVLLRGIRTGEGNLPGFVPGCLAIVNSCVGGAKQYEMF